MPLVKDDDNLATALSAHDIYKLDGYVPLTEKSGETSDINQFCKLEQFEWVTFHDETILFLNDILKLGHYLGPSIDVSPAMIVKILT